MTSALSHLCVVEIGCGVAAPFCARLFADMGAEVIKVERPSGDVTRLHGPFEADRPDPEESGLFHFLNAGKKGIVTDLDRADELEVFHRLLASADVLIENASSEERRRWGLEFEALSERHPQLIAVSVSPYGRGGPWSDRPGTDLTVQAVSALPVAIGWPDRAPLPLPYDQAEYQAGFHALAAALCAVRERSASGLGQGIDVSAAQVLAYQVGAMALVTGRRGFEWQRAGNRLKGTLYPTAFFEARDGHVCIVTLHGRQWLKWIELMGNPDWAQDKQNLDVFRLGAKGEDEPVDIAFRKWLKAFTRDELVALGKANDLIVGAVSDVGQVLDSRQFAFRDQWAWIRIGSSDVRLPKPGYAFSETPIAIEARGPALNADGTALHGRSPSSIPLKQGRRRAGALQGIRVLDFGWNWAGPMAGQLLADMGAEVIRIESTLRLDNMRAFDYAADFFCHNNRSKLSATFNIADPRGAELVRKLATKCDIVMDNFAAGVMARNGLSYSELSQANPRIIVVSMSMAGQTGPERDLRGFASISSAYVGLEGMVGYPESGETTGFMAFGLGDTAQSIQGVIGALVALIHRERTGQGQFVDMSQIASLCASLGEPLIDYQLNGRSAGIMGFRHPVYIPHGIYPCNGRRWIALAVRNEAEWTALCKAMGRVDWLSDAGLRSPQQRRNRAEDLDRGIRQWIDGQDRDVLVEQLCMAGVPAAPVLELKERNVHPVFAGRGLTLRHQGGPTEPCEIYATPWHFTATPPRIWRPTPAVGEHNDYVHGELLGLDACEIARLREEKVLV